MTIVITDEVENTVIFVAFLAFFGWMTWLGYTTDDIYKVLEGAVPFLMVARSISNQPGSLLSGLVTVQRSNGEQQKKEGKE